MRHLRTRDIDGVRHYRCFKCRGWFRVQRMCRMARLPAGITAECKPCRNARRNEARDRRALRLRALGVVSFDRGTL